VVSHRGGKSATPAATGSAKWTSSARRCRVPTSLAGWEKSIRERSAERATSRLTDFTIEKDRVAVEAESSATSRDDRMCENVYRFVVFVRSGEIERPREYTDTHPLVELYSRPRAQGQGDGHPAGI